MAHLAKCWKRVVIRARKEKQWLFPTLWPLSQQIIGVVSSSKNWHLQIHENHRQSLLLFLMSWHHIKSSKFLMKVRFLHNRKTSVINTVQTFIGPSWQYAASSLPFLIGTEWSRANTTRQQQTKRVPECWDEGHWHIVSSEILHVRQREHHAGRLRLFRDLCQTLWYM